MEGAFLRTDARRFDDLSGAGGRVLGMPNIDSLAEEERQLPYKTSYAGSIYGSQGHSQEVCLDGIALTDPTLQGETRCIAIGVSIEAIDQFQSEGAGSSTSITDAYVSSVGGRLRDHSGGQRGQLLRRLQPRFLGAGAHRRHSPVELRRGPWHTEFAVRSPITRT